MGARAEGGGPRPPERRLRANAVRLMTAGANHLVGQRGELGLRAHAPPGEVRHGTARRPPQRAVAEHCLEGYAPAPTGG